MIKLVFLIYLENKLDNGNNIDEIIYLENIYLPQGISIISKNNYLSKALYLYEFVNGELIKILGKNSFKQNPYIDEISFFVCIM